MAGFPDPAQWISGNPIPIARWFDNGFDWLTGNASWVIDGAASAVARAVDQVQRLFEAPHPFVIIAIAVGLTCLFRRSWGAMLTVGLGYLFILNLGYWQQTMQSLTLVALACLVCMGIGIPLGILAAHVPRLYAIMRPILDLMQTLPSFVYLVPGVMLFGLGTVAGLFATVIFVLPAPIRLTWLGISQTPPALIEAGRAFGASPFQLLWKVELPSARPQILAGLNQTIMLSLSMVVIAAMVGAAGLGIPIMRALSSMQVGKGFEAGFAIVALALCLDRMLPEGQRKDKEKPRLDFWK